MNTDRRTNYIERFRHSDDLFRTLFEVASVGMAIVDVATRRLLHVNDKYCQITGYARAELLEMRTPDLTYVEDRQMDAEKYQSATDGTLPQHLIEKRLLRKDGVIVWVRVNSAFVRDASGNAVRGMAVIEDITERKHAEAALQAVELRFRQLFEHAPVAYQSLDAEGCLQHVNEAYCELLGYTPDELLGKSFDALWARPDRQQFNAAFGSFKQDTRCHNVLRLLKKNGDEIAVLLEGRTERDAAGEFVRTHCVLIDMTERLKAETALIESEHRLRELLDGIPGRAWFKDTECRYLFLNSREASAQGVPADSLIGKSVRDFRPASEVDGVMGEDEQVLRSGKTLRIERPSNITGTWAEIVKAPVRRVDGTVIGMVGILRDITERKRVENELLAAKSAAEAAKLTAEAANRAKGEFLAHMSHEMRTPMNAILGFTELALLDQPQGEQRDNLETIGMAAQSLLRVIDDVLDFERIDAGQLSLEIIDFSLNDVLRNVRDVLAGVAQAKGLALRLKTDDSVPARLKGDPARIGQILMNLCANAIKFTPHGTVEVLVRLDGVADTGVTLYFEVRDTGIGVSAEEQARLFQPFMQADSSTTRRYGGTGLGLVICKRLVELMHGRIGIESEPEKGKAGTVVFFTLVCGVATSTAPERAARSAVLPVEAAALRGARVLVVDDHPVNRMLLAKLLKLAGAHAVLAGNGREALDALEQGADADLILMDLRMPEMDGFETTRRIRADVRWKHLPIVAVTASATTHERARCMAAGMNDVLVKPVQQATFFPAVAAWMKN